MNSKIRENIKSIVRGDAPKGFIKTEAGVIPEDWAATKLGDRMRVFRGASPRPKGDTRYYGGDIPRLMIEDVTRDGKYAYPSIDSLTEEGAKKSRFLPKGSVVLSCSGTKVGIPGILGIDACIHDGFFGFDELDRIDPEFLYYFFGLLNIKLQSSATRGGVFNNLTTQIMKNLPVGLPEVPEQIKLVEVLSTWDKAIELKEQLIEEKKLQKKGLMKKLLTGEVRLPGFEGEWRIVKISDIIKESKVLERDPDLARQLTVRLNLNGVCIREINGTEKKGATTLYKRYAGQFIYGKQNFHNGAIGIVPKGLDGYATSSDIPSFDFVNDFDPMFFYYYWSRESLYKSMENLTTGTGSKRLNPNTFLALEMSIPGLIEQKAISEIINTSDRELELLEKELIALKYQKKGLMQLLLTGIVRVNDIEN